MINRQLWLILLLAAGCEGTVSDLTGELVSPADDSTNGSSSGRGGGAGGRADGAGGGASSTGGGGSSDGATGGGAGAAGGGTAGPGGGEATSGAGLPCDVSAFLKSKCSACHGETATGVQLTTREALAGPSFEPGKTAGQLALELMASTSNPMPPSGLPAPTSAEVAAFTSWVNAGMPVGTCGDADAGAPSSADAGTPSPADAGTPSRADAGVPTPVCTSGTSWTGGNRGSRSMNPGQACVQCHRANGATREIFVFAGTVYPSLHEKDLCQAKPPSGVRVEIYDKNGALALTMTPDSTSGNFHSSTSVSVAMPYTAKVVSSQGTTTMKGPQTNGDCNVCHTALGTDGAPGRVTWSP